MADLEDEHVYGLAVGLGSAGAFLVLAFVNAMFCKYSQLLPKGKDIFVHTTFFSPSACLFSLQLFETPHRDIDTHRDT